MQSKLLILLLVMGLLWTQEHGYFLLWKMKEKLYILPKYSTFIHQSWWVVDPPIAFSGWKWVFWLGDHVTSDLVNERWILGQYIALFLKMKWHIMVNFKHSNTLHISSMIFIFTLGHIGIAGVMYHLNVKLSTHPSDIAKWNANCR